MVLMVITVCKLSRCFMIPFGYSVFDAFVSSCIVSKLRTCNRLSLYSFLVSCGFSRKSVHSSLSSYTLM